MMKTSVSIGGTRNKPPYHFDAKDCIAKAFADETNLKEFLMDSGGKSRLPKGFE